MADKAKQMRRRAMEQYTLDQMVEYYLEAKHAENVSPKTLLNAKSNLNKFLRFLEQQGHSMRLVDLTIHDARRYITQLQGKVIKYEGHPFNPHIQNAEYKQSTIWSHARTLHAWSNWMLREGHTPAAVFELLKMPKKGNYKPVILKPEEVQRVLGSIKRDTLLGSRNYAIVLVFLDTAIRAGELVGLRLSNIDWKSGILKVRGKGDKERYVPISAQTLSALRDYIQKYRPQPVMPERDHAFLNLQGESLTVNAIVHLMWGLRKSSGVPHLRAHLLRHTSAAYYTFAGGDTKSLQSFLGHETPTTSLIYQEHLEEMRTAMHRKFNPLTAMGIATGNRPKNTKREHREENPFGESK